MNSSASTRLRLSRRFRPALNGLETRELAATAVSSLFVTPAILAPPNGHYVRVTVSGKVFESSAKLTPLGMYQVVDEYARIQPGGKVAYRRVDPTTFTYRFTIVLEASRANSDPSGRQYNVIVGSQDGQNANGLAVSVLVPKNAVAPGQAAQTLSVSRFQRWHAHR